MKWRKLGKIFDPKDYILPDGCTEFAQSPQALVLPNAIRIYFSTRRRDETGKYLSHVAYADFDRTLSKVLEVSQHTIVPLGELGAFDEHGIFPLSPTRDGDRVLGYTTGWNRRVSVSADSAVGLTISTDNGRTFKRHGTGPVLASSLHEPFLVADAFVAKHGDRFHMWYIFGTEWSRVAEGQSPDRVYKIAHATSEDGISWAREGRQIVSSQLGSSECQALPTVAYVDGHYVMMFCFRSQFGFRDGRDGAYRIGCATSQDLTNWTRQEDAGIDVSREGWDSEMQCYPSIFECDGVVYLLYNGNQFGRNGFGVAVLER